MAQDSSKKHPSSLSVILNLIQDLINNWILNQVQDDTGGYEIKIPVSTYTNKEHRLLLKASFQKSEMCSLRVVHLKAL